MRPDESMAHDAVLYDRMRWFVGLRWGAGAIVLAASLIDLWWFKRFAMSPWMIGVGAAILGYNVLLRRLLATARRRREWLLWLAPGQILADLCCLTLLTLWTGGAQSPLLGFFVFHMIFASLLLRRWMAFATAGAATCMVVAGLALTDQWPEDPHHVDTVIAWIVVLALTVFLVNGIVKRLRRHRQQLIIQNRRNSEMARRLREQQQAMVQHEKMAAMSQMAAGVAHEIANPLASIDSLLQQMKRKSERLTEENVDKLLGLAERIRHTIRQMTEFAHPAHAQWRTMPLSDLAAMGLEMMRYDHRSRQIDIRRRFEADECEVRVQAQAVQQVIVNLLINAMDAVADVPDPWIELSTAVVEGFGRIEVQDNGPGIAPELLERVFEPFYTTKPVGKGTGLGLSISHTLITNLGGRIRVLNASTGGTRAQIDLPLAGGDAGSPQTV